MNPLLIKYFNDIRKYQIYDGDTLKDLIKKAQQGDTTAKDKVVKSTLRFVVTIAKTFQNRGLDIMDLISAGNIGLLRAIELYNPEKNNSFLSYATWWIRQKIYTLIYNNGNAIRIPMNQRVLLLNLHSESQKFEQEFKREPSIDELAEIVGIPSETIHFLYQYKNKPMSVDDYVAGDEDKSQLCDVIPDTNYSLEKETEYKLASETLKKVLDTLPDKYHDILHMVFGIDMIPVSLREISKMFNMTYERIRQMKYEALARLKKRCGRKLNLLKDDILNQ